VLASAVAIFVGLWAFLDGDAHWQTLLFTTLVFSQLALALGVRSETRALWTIGLGSNRAMLGAVALTVLLQLAVVYLPFLQTIFGTTAMPARDLLIAVLAAVVVLVAVEVWKWGLRMRGGAATAR
jgi:Ca2+-transporting ATPase